ncbi:uncharacterized protein LTR77_008554 [Saxophila tyrrhenica]|uniref:Major facilitator superfamily (MFS) profile domain-containing protein n=1 Tax=Saxophila tyrrhenica TaxID=1690608 RepID=A0AAV9P569_9PEZI|nr:hypothetical protein LTR77_008554 [Saxophila tyrrhenica]
MGLYLASLIILVAGPIAFENISWKFFFVLIVPTFFHIIFVYFMCPETKGRSLEDINAQFGEQVAIHYYGATDKEKMEFDVAVEEDEKVDQTGEVDRNGLTKVVADHTHVEEVTHHKV